MLELLVLAQLETGGFDLTMHSFMVRAGVGRVQVTAHNRTQKDAKRVFVECAIMDKNGTQRAIAREIIPNIRAGQSAHGEAAVVAFKGMDAADCRVSQVTFD
jgi:hypothetical protein